MANDRLLPLVRIALQAENFRLQPSALLSPCLPPSFWTGTRRWVLRAVEAGLLSSDMLKAAKSSVHAAPAGFQVGTSAEA